MTGLDPGSISCSERGAAGGMRSRWADVLVDPHDGVQAMHRGSPRAKTAGDRWTVCGQWVGLMTRVTVDEVDPGAAHRPPPLPTALALEPMFRCRVCSCFSLDRIRNRLSIVPRSHWDDPMDKAIISDSHLIDFLPGTHAFLRNEAAPPWAQG